MHAFMKLIYMTSGCFKMEVSMRFLNVFSNMDS